MSTSCAKPANLIHLINKIDLVKYISFELSQCANHVVLAKYTKGKLHKPLKILGSFWIQALMLSFVTLPVSLRRFFLTSVTWLSNFKVHDCFTEHKNNMYKVFFF